MSTFSVNNSYYYDNGQDEDDAEIEYYYKNGELQCYSYKGVFYAAEYPEHLAKFQCDFGEESNMNSIGRPDIDDSEQLDCELLESECNELYHQLIDEHGYEKVERCAIEGLMRFIRSFTNPEEMRKKINTALLIPYSKMYNQNWAWTDWDWFTGQLNKHDDEIHRWTFTDEECESIRMWRFPETTVTASRGNRGNSVDVVEGVSQETVRNMVEPSRMERLIYARELEEGEIVEYNSGDDN
jgi:hypothetical protein